MSKLFQSVPQDCTNKCTSVLHGDILSAAITKREIQDELLCAYLVNVCCRCESVRDSQGRTTLHMAASCGRNTLVMWLIQNRCANINSRDSESGYTPLHRCIFYGKLDTAVELIKLGANLGIQDLEGLSFLEHAMIDGLKPSVDSVGGELYTWGTNSNNSLGPQPPRTVPELLDVFHKKYSRESVHEVSLSRFHSIILTASGKCYSCGHGQGGRLCLGIEHAEVVPKQINFPKFHSSDSVIIQCSISRDHSLFLNSDSCIFSCGLNTYKLLGIIPPPPQVLVPRQTKNVPIDLAGISANVFHSLAWGSTGLYTWGLNAGQIGHQLLNKNEDKYITSPKLVKSFNYSVSKLKLVCSSNAAIVVYTEKGDLYVLHEYQCLYTWGLNAGQIGHQLLNKNEDKYITSPKLVKSFNYSVSKLKLVCSSNAAIVVYTEKGDLYVLHEYQCKKIASKQLNLVQVSSVGGKLNLSLEPELTARQNKELRVAALTNTGNLLIWQESDPYLLRCIFSVNRALVIRQMTLNDREVPPYRPHNFPGTESGMAGDLLNLLEDNVTFDGIQDVSFQTEGRTFSAHKYIIASSSSYLEKLMSDYNENTSIALKGVDPDIFEQLLCFIYTKHSDLTVCGPLLNVKLQSVGSRNEYGVEDEKSSEIRKSKANKENKIQNPVRMLHELSKRMEVTDLQKILSDLELHNNIIKPKTDATIKVPFLKFNRLSFPELYDVRITCKDKKVIKAHKCILAARMEYFNSMFSMRWGGSNLTEVSLPFPEPVVMSLLEYLYTDSLSSLENKEIDHLFKVLVLADQFFVTRLKKECEVHLTDLVTLKNCAQIFSLAHAYNALNLKYWCIRFILLNLTAVLELRVLDDLDTERLQELSRVYFEESPHLWCRVITPYSTAVTDEEIIEISSSHPTDLEEKVVKVKKSATKKRTRSHKTSISEKIADTSRIEGNEIIIETSVEDKVVGSPNTKPSVNDSCRLSSILKASNKISEEEVETEFMSLSQKFENAKLSSSFTDSNEFPLLNSPTGNSMSHRSTHKTEKHKIIRMSQKQRKRLSSQSSTHEEIGSPETPEPRKNPWKIETEVESLSSSLSNSVNMETIILSEIKEKENLNKLKSKQLMFTQIEDKAIEELLIFYNASNTVDEVIVVERVNIGAIATPVWVPRSK